MKKFADACDLAAALDEVAGAIMSEDYLRFRYDTEYTASFELDIYKDDEDGFAYKLRRELEVGDRVPRVVRNLLGGSFVMLQQAHWQRDGEGYQGRARLSAERFSGGIDIDIQIEAIDDENCRLSFQGQLQAEVPIIGRQLERMMAERVSDNFAESMQAIEEYLKEKTQG